MGVNVEGYSNAGVAQAFTDDLRMDPLLLHQAGIGVSQVMKPDMWEAGLLDDICEGVADESIAGTARGQPGQDNHDGQRHRYNVQVVAPNA